MNNNTLEQAITRIFEDNPDKTFRLQEVYK